MVVNAHASGKTEGFTSFAFVRMSHGMMSAAFSGINERADRKEKATMKRTQLNDCWGFYKRGEEAKKILLDLPHDAMQLEKRGEKAGTRGAGAY